MYRNHKMQAAAWLIIVVLFAAGGAVSAQSLNTLSKKEKRQGWKLLFDGKDLQGWHTYLKGEPAAAWTVEDGAIKLDHSQHRRGGDLVTDGEYENYELSLQWKISPEGNSGIIFNVHEDPQYRATYLTGPEMQVLDNEKAEDNKKDNHLAGSLYDLIATDPNTVHPVGKWNTVNIRVDKGHLTFRMNGKKVVEAQIGSPAWKDKVAHSKFRNWKGFAAFPKGHIALQDHGHTVWYRNIKIREL